MVVWRRQQSNDCSLSATVVRLQAGRENEIHYS